MSKTKSRADVLDEAIAIYGTGEGALMPVMQAVQRGEGYLSEESLKAISRRLKLPISRIYGVATFYSQFRLHKCGKHTVKVCQGTACHVGGADAVTDALKEQLKIDVDETTADGKFTLETVACLGCCSLAPVMMVDDKTHGRLAADTVKRVMKQYEHHE
ncbi:MAG: NADH-quinone oxidoreductase subunit NuoE [Chloroflexi bacterium]|nr:NADH-quinone oxidoreductase subunit NuoE [Chloroflexota bacterium]